MDIVGRGEYVWFIVGGLMGWKLWLVVDAEGAKSAWVRFFNEGIV